MLSTLGTGISQRVPDWLDEVTVYSLWGRFEYDKYLNHFNNN